MKLKKIYIEITNACNLNCDFCIHNDRKIIYMDMNNYKYIIDKIKNNAKEIYLHVLGEPLMHKDINEFIDYANDRGLLVNITTNGYLIDKIANNKNIHRLNISMHSFNNKYNINEYLDNICNVIDKIKDKTFITLRFWAKNDNSKYMIDYLNKRYNANIDINNISKTKIASNLIIDIFKPFIWPSLDNNYYKTTGKCMGLIDHIGILSDGTIIPCCLDSKGIIKLGNIYHDNIDNIFDKEMVKEMIDGFKNNYKCQELCRHCNFYDIK